MEEAPPLIPIQPVQMIPEIQVNAAVDDQLVLPVEEVIQNFQPHPQTPPLADEQVLAMDDDTDTDSDVHPQAQLPIPPVEIVAFPDFNNLQSLMPEEFQEEELLGWING